MVHLDNCLVHTSRASTDWLEEHGIHRMPHPPYLPHLASSHFYLFPTVKENPEQIQVADEDQFFESLQEILKDIDQKELNGIFQAWARGFKK
jgi:hypothetical protein